MTPNRIGSAGSSAVIEIVLPNNINFVSSGTPGRYLSSFAGITLFHIAPAARTSNLSETIEAEERKRALTHSGPDSATDLRDEEHNSGDHCDVLVRYGGLGSDLRCDGGDTTSNRLDDLRDDELRIATKIFSVEARGLAMQKSTYGASAPREWIINPTPKSRIARPIISMY